MALAHLIREKYATQGEICDSTRLVAMMLSKRETSPFHHPFHQKACPRETLTWYNGNMNYEEITRWWRERNPKTADELDTALEKTWRRRPPQRKLLREHLEGYDI
ncbi:MAG: hypothetical protein IJ132_03655 [Firmicutes bacterium]|nr:hypothetical protein [Bacillota bacterium]